MNSHTFLLPDPSNKMDGMDNWPNSTVTPWIATQAAVNATENPRLEQLTYQLGMTRFVVSCILVPLVVAVGVTGNFMNIAVLTRRWMRSSTNYYLTILALYDVLYLIFAFTLLFKHYTNVKGLKWYQYYKYHVGVPMANTCSNTGVWMTLTFTIERYIGVCHPMKGKRWCTPERAKYVILVVCAVVAIITFPDFFAKKIQPSFNPKTNTTEYKATETAIAQHVSYSVGYSYGTQVLFTFLPLILLMVFNLLLIRAVMMATRQRRTMAQVQNERQERHNRDQHRITVMLITVVIVFLLCHTPQAIQHIILSYLINNGGPTREQITLLTLTANVFNLFVIINSSANFILYSAFSTKFRRTFSKLFCRCIQNRRSASEIMFSEGVTTAQPSNDESRTHLLQANRGKTHVTYNWPRQAAGNRNNNSGLRKHHGNAVSLENRQQSNGNTRNGYMAGKAQRQNIVSCV